MSKNFARELRNASLALGSAAWQHATGGSLNDFLENSIEDGDSGVEVGAKVIDYFCLDDSRTFCRYTQTVQFAIKFLDQIGQSRIDQKRFLPDLKQLFAEAPSYEEILKFVRAHIGT